MTHVVLLAHVAATWFMVGIIWIIQRVHYPLFDRVVQDDFIRFEADHQQRIFPLVGPGMLVELITGIWLAVIRPVPIPLWMVWTGLGLIAVNVLSTAIIQIPLHEHLAKVGYDSETHARMVQSNWLRTAAWTLRGLLTLGMLAMMMRSQASGDM